MNHPALSVAQSAKFIKYNYPEYLSSPPTLHDLKTIYGLYLFSLNHISTLGDNFYNEFNALSRSSHTVRKHLNRKRDLLLEELLKLYED